MEGGSVSPAISVPLRRTNEAYLGRVGPGLNVAQTSLWIACAMSLAMLDIEKCIDEFGNVVEPEVCYQDGVIR